MVDVHTLINHEGVDTHRFNILVTNGSQEVTGVNTPDKDGNTPLMYAIKFTNPDIAKELLKRGADINAKNKAGETAMTFASKRQDREARKVLVNFLLNMGVDEEAKKLGKETLEKYEQEKKEEADLLKLEERVRNFKANPTYIKKANALAGLMARMYKYDVIQGKIKPTRLYKTFGPRGQLTEQEKEEVRKLNEQIQPLKEWVDNADAQLKLLIEEQEKAYEKRRQAQTGSKRKTLKRKRARRSKKTRGRR